MLSSVVHCVIIISLVCVDLIHSYPEPLVELPLEDILNDEIPEDATPLSTNNETASPPWSAEKDNRQVPFFASSECPLPPNFPFGMYANVGNYRNWAEEFSVSNLWIVHPRNPNDVVALANWAYIYGYKLRAKGFGNSWAPLTVTKNAKCSNTVLIDTTKYLTQMKMVSSKSDSDLRAVHVQTGASMESLLEFLSHHRAALYAAPMMGESTIGGVLAVGGHGVGAPRMGTRIPAGYSAGSLSNLILSFKTVIWDYESQSYVLRKFTRLDEDATAFLTHLGRAFITDVRLLVGPLYNLRCESRFDFNSERLLSRPTRIETDQETLAGLVERYNTVDLTVYPYTESLWAMICTNSSRNLSGSTYIERPYAFGTNTNSVPRPLSTLTSQFLAGFHYLSPVISRAEFQMDMLKVKYDKTEDIWGTSNNMLLRFKNTFKRTASSGYAIITNRARVQTITSDFYSYYNSLVTKYAGGWRFPQNEPMQISITGLDSPTDIPGLGEFSPPALSFLAPMREKDFDTAILIGINAIPGTRNFESFMREVETYLFLKYDGEEAVVRPEWAKSWAWTDLAAWDNNIMLKKVIPNSFGDKWNWALERFEYYDPYRIFSNDFLDTFLKANGTYRHKAS